MKPIMVIRTIVLMLISPLYGQWEILYQGIGVVKNIDFVDDQIGWISGKQGTLLKTEDGGQTWRLLPLDERWDIHLIDFYNKSVGWAVIYEESNGRKGKIIKSIDGGLTWHIQKDLTSRWEIPVNALMAVDLNTCCAILRDRKPKFVKTVDGGISWKETELNTMSRSYYSLWFFNKDRGIVAGTFVNVGDGATSEVALLLKTEDGGETWTETTNMKWEPIFNLQFVDDSTGFFISGSILFKTKDAFENGSRTFLLGNVGSYFAFDKNTIFAAAERPMKSTNGGKTWKKIAPDTWGIIKIYFYSPQVGFLSGSALCNFLRTDDAGVTWRNQFMDYPFHDVHFIDKNTGFACGGYYEMHGGDGYFFITQNGGKSWDVTSEKQSQVGKCFFLNDKIGYAFINRQWRTGQDFFSLFKTEDGGKTWLDKNPNLDGRDLYFVNESIGWAVGRYQEKDSTNEGGFRDYTAGAGIFKTTNQGDSWELVWKCPDENEKYRVLDSIHFANENIGCAAGNYGMLVKCTDGEYWQSQSSISDMPILKIFFVDEDNGFIACSYLSGEDQRTGMFKTGNGGVTWEKLPDCLIFVNDIYFYDSRQGWAIGSDKFGKGVIQQTQDGGEHWSEEVSHLTAPLHAFSYHDGFLWVVGESSLVLRKSLSTAIKDKKQGVPFCSHLFQNYPNPFNPSTTIEFALPKSAFVTLTVYNLRGEQVATLLAEQRQAGIHQFNWDAGGLASGVYLYRLEAGEFTQSKKLILMR